MKICTDENIPSMTVRALRAMGHDVLDIRSTEGKSMEDDSLWDMIRRGKRLFITTNKGFAGNLGRVGRMRG